MVSSSHPSINQQLIDNIRWIEQAGENDLVVGSQARILYANDVGRRKIALAMNQAIADGEITAPIVLGRDHHDVSGTDSLTEKLQISRMVLCSQPIWPCKILSVTHLEAQRG